ncbi:MAG: YihY/virulence factor BrkB family protein, partial [Bacteroidota bacterium]
RMALAVGGLFVLTFGLTLAMSTLSASGLELAQRVGLDYVWLEDGWRRTFKFLGLLVPFLLTTTMFGLLYYSIPKPHPPRRSVLVGAVCAAALWEGAKSGFAWYATNLGRFDRYSGTGGEAGIAAVGDTFGLIIAFVLWIYLSSVLLILGALITLLHETYRRRQMPDPSPSAPDPMSVDSAEMVGPRLPIEAVDAAGPASGMPPAEAEEPMAAPREEEAPPSLKPPLAPPDRPVEQRP